MLKYLTVFQPWCAHEGEDFHWMGRTRCRLTFRRLSPRYYGHAADDRSLTRSTLPRSKRKCGRRLLYASVDSVPDGDLLQDGSWKRQHEGIDYHRHDRDAHSALGPGGGPRAYVAPGA